MISVKQSLIYLSLTILVTLVLECTYFSDEKEIYRALKEKVERGEKEILLSEVTTFEWDTVYFFQKFSTSHGISTVSNTNCYTNAWDDEYVLLFKKQGKLVSSTCYSVFFTPLRIDDKWKRQELKSKAFCEYMVFDSNTSFKLTGSTLTPVKELSP